MVMVRRIGIPVWELKRLELEKVEERREGELYVSSVGHLIAMDFLLEGFSCGCWGHFDVII
jgi:hypothetical protein